MDSLCWPGDECGVRAPHTNFAFTIAGEPYGTRTVSASSNSATVFQGVSAVSALSPGMFLNLDGAIQSDGSLLATRIEVEAYSAINDSSGPVMFVDNLAPLFSSTAVPKWALC